MRYARAAGHSIEHPRGAGIDAGTGPVNKRIVDIMVGNGGTDGVQVSGHSTLSRGISSVTRETGKAYRRSIAFASTVVVLAYTVFLVHHRHALSDISSHCMIPCVFERATRCFQHQINLRCIHLVLRIVPWKP